MSTFNLTESCLRRSSHRDIDSPSQLELQSLDVRQVE